MREREGPRVAGRVRVGAPAPKENSDIFSRIDLWRLARLTLIRLATLATFSRNAGEGTQANRSVIPAAGITHNLRDFPAETLDRYGIEAQHPDEFIRRLLDLSPALVVDAVRAQQAGLTRPPIPMTELLDLFERLGLAKTVTELRRLIGSQDEDAASGS